jgi:hypothetical protein
LHIEFDKENSESMSSSCNKGNNFNFYNIPGKGCQNGLVIYVSIEFKSMMFLNYKTHEIGKKKKKGEILPL